VVDYVHYWKERAEIPAKQILRWMKVSEGTFYNWRQRYGKVNEHNGWIPRDHWLEEWEKRAILDFYWDHPLEGYRRLTYMMLDANVVAASATSVYRVLKRAGVMNRRNSKPSQKGKGFHQPGRPHRHWHVDIAYLNIAGTFYFLCSVLDGYSRFIVHWEIREKMEEIDVETILQRAREEYPDETPRIITDNGPQFIAKEFKHFIRISGMTHVKTSPYYPQSNGKLERYHRTIKSECIRPKTPLSLEDARRVVTTYVRQYNEERLHSALQYVTPLDKLLGREQAIFAERDRKLEEARALRAQRRAEQRPQLRERGRDATLEVDWAEDTALRGRNRSADPVAKTEESGSLPGQGANSSVTSRDPNSSGLAPRRQIPGGLGDSVPHSRKSAEGPSSTC
jgi:transposase InsO family protein